MSNTEREAEDAYETQNDDNPPVSADVGDNDYKSRTGQSQVPVVSDDAAVDAPVEANEQNTDAQLQQDDADAIDKNNIISGRTRGAKPVTGEYNEGPDEDQLPEEVRVGADGRTV